MGDKEGLGALQHQDKNAWGSELVISFCLSLNLFTLSLDHLDIPLFIRHINHQDANLGSF